MTQVNLVKNVVVRNEFPEDVPVPKFLVDDRGHLLKRNRNLSSKTQSLKKNGIDVKNINSFSIVPDTGSYGFTFSPLGYNSRAERPNIILKGCRPGCRETNPNAHQTLRKLHTEYTYNNKSLRKTFKDKLSSSYSYQQPSPTHFRE